LRSRVIASDCEAIQTKPSSHSLVERFDEIYGAFPSPLAGEGVIALAMTDEGLLKKERRRRAQRYILKEPLIPPASRATFSRKGRRVCVL
jgi:hypothetical protein